MSNQSDGGTLSIATLLLNIKTGVDTYASRLKFVADTRWQTQKVAVTSEDGDDERLASLIPEIQDTTALIQKCMKNEADHSITNCEASSIERPQRSLEHRYLDLMKVLQFGRSSSYTNVSSNSECFYLHRLCGDGRQWWERYPLRCVLPLRRRCCGQRLESSVTSKTTCSGNRYTVD